MRLLISGSSGLIGRHLAAHRSAKGDVVVPLWRHPGSEPGVHPDAEGRLHPASLAGFDAVIHLAGEPVAAGRWTPERKRRIRDSRVEGTQRLVAALLASGAPPGVFLCASGINVYGDNGSRVLDENAPEGAGFLAEVCVAWERATEPLASVARVVQLRLGAVLSPAGGALASMLPLLRAGLAGRIAGGQQYVSWISLHDTLRATDHLLEASRLAGPVNLVAPEPVTSREFTELTAAAVGRPARLPVPAWAARLLLGEMAGDTVLASVRVVPGRLHADGFAFQDPELAQALARMGLRAGLARER